MINNFNICHWHWHRDHPSQLDNRDSDRGSVAQRGRVTESTANSPRARARALRFKLMLAPQVGDTSVNFHARPRAELDSQARGHAFSRYEHAQRFLMTRNWTTLLNDDNAFLLQVKDIAATYPFHINNETFANC